MGGGGAEVIGEISDLRRLVTNVLKSSCVCAPSQFKYADYQRYRVKSKSWNSLYY